jgi:excisionase family DNA binding protein
VKPDAHEVPTPLRGRAPFRGEDGSALNRGESLLTLREVAGQLAVSPRTVRRLVAVGELRCVRIGRLIRVHPGDVSRWLSARKE